ncbi:PREDICTED: protein EARLY FLOWERING 4 [Camelina sativa]|uniref:Protein EARLY FLOWERING 4 n=1 Tax=Camelina sativa TaxID=90675 RepID=A0ABM0YTN9_CAMSA|nr:PREDICTED: protein EARLY FLOWERING 4 [Camelina sativa]XP_010517400.1 PREDICTED: protein EARLY FLOWERING 4 [Camelina sativa]
MKRNGDTKRRRNVAEEAEHGGEDPAMWENLDRNFRQVQSVLDRNRSLIQQVNDNHQSRMADNMSKNVALIQELNGNISKVVNMYSDLNTSFASGFGKNGHDGGGAAGTRA